MLDKMLSLVLAFSTTREEWNQRIFLRSRRNGRKVHRRVENRRKYVKESTNLFYDSSEYQARLRSRTKLKRYGWIQSKDSRYTYILGGSKRSMTLPIGIH